MKSLNWLLYQVHRWVGLVLGLFMFFWFSTGLVIMYAHPTTQSHSEQLAHAESLNPEYNWQTLGTVWQHYLASENPPTTQQIDKPTEKVDKPAVSEQKSSPPPSIVDARLVRSAGEPLWIIEDAKGQFIALSAIDGALHKTSTDQALQIAKNWYNNQGQYGIKVRFIETVDSSQILRNQDNLKPFHLITVNDGDELLISEKTGEVLHASTPIDRAFYWAGNWIHLFKPLELISLGKIRNDVQLYLGLFATITTLTGIIIGWLRWRPGIGGRPTYSKGRTQPYREFWFKWHFWSGLMGGIVVLSWAFSGFISTNPAKIFSAATPSKDEVARFIGKNSSSIINDWHPSLPASLAVAVDDADIVELNWRQLNDEALLIATRRDGQRTSQSINGEPNRLQFSENTLLKAVARATKDTPIASQAIINEYDSYYYPRHHQTVIDKPLPVLQVKLADDAGTYFYIDPQDGRILAKLDQSRRIYRWLYSALHHWDFGWLNIRPIWDIWMLLWVTFGLVLGTSSLVLGWKLLKKTFKPKKKTATRKRRIPVDVYSLEPELSNQSAQEVNQI